MKKLYSYLLLFLPFALLACSDDEVTPDKVVTNDTIAPIVSIEAPVANDSFLVIDMVRINAVVADENRLELVRVVSVDPGGVSEVLAEKIITIYSNFRRYQVGTALRLPKFAATGEYTIMVEARDVGRNETRNSVTFAMHAPALRHAQFTRSFTEGFSLTYLHSMDWLGYDTERGIYFNETWLTLGLYLMASTDGEYEISEVEWSRFIADFGVKDQAWSKWDADGNGKLSEAEFHNGLGRLNLFTDWDTDKNKFISNEEMARGIFTRWDSNRDGLLSKEEYLEKFYTYLY